MRRVVVLAILALALPMAAWADGITLTNEHGSISISTSGISSVGSQLTSFNGIIAPPGHAMGSVSFTTGALEAGGSILNGGVFSSTGSTFTVIGKGSYGQPKGVIFSGTFVGNIDWTLDSVVGQKRTYTLSGEIEGMLYTGREVMGNTQQTIVSSTQQITGGVGHITLGGTHLSTPEPGTLGLLGTGLVGIAGMVRRMKAA